MAGTAILLGRHVNNRFTGGDHIVVARGAENAEVGLDSGMIKNPCGKVARRMADIAVFREDRHMVGVRDAQRIGAIVACIASLSHYVRAGVINKSIREICGVMARRAIGAR